MVRWLIAGLVALTACPLIAKDNTDPPSPQEAVKRMTLPPGFTVNLVAGEPTLIKPIAMTTDGRGRIWVVESHSYPNWLPAGKTGKDRILILEPDGKGGYSSKVFWDKGTNLSGIALGFDGIYLCAVPNLLFVPLVPGEDRAAGPPRVLLDGWSTTTKHNVFNCLTWGPDGWLYGCNGIQSSSRVGAPGRRTRNERASTAAYGATTRRGTSSRRSPTAPPTPGGWTSTITARCSSPTA